MKLDRARTSLKRITDGDDNYVDATPAERLSMVWELTEEAWSLKSRDDAERRLQRHITNLIRTGS